MSGAAPLLELRDLGVARGPCATLNGVTFSVRAGECVGLIGPNGAGKTTLLRGALGLLAATGHSSLAALRPRARAAHAAWLPQSREIAWPVTVETLVALGRQPHIGLAGRLGAQDRAALDDALGRMGLDNFRTRDATQLSGGEAARVLIARALAQQTPLILADEPTAGLDPAHQIDAMALFADLAAEGRGVVVSLHDLGMAARYCTRLVILDRGRVVGDGAPLDVLTPDLLRAVFGLDACLEQRAHGVDLRIHGRAG